MVELIELQGRLQSSREVWKKKQAAAEEGGEETTYFYAKGIIYGLTIAIREIGILLRVERA